MGSEHCFVSFSMTEWVMGSCGTTKCWVNATVQTGTVRRSIIFYQGTCSLVGNWKCNKKITELVFVFWQTITELVEIFIQGNLSMFRGHFERLCFLLPISYTLKYVLFVKKSQDSSPKICHLCHSKPEPETFICGIQKNIFWQMF